MRRDAPRFGVRRKVVQPAFVVALLSLLLLVCWSQVTLAQGEPAEVQFAEHVVFVHHDVPGLTPAKKRAQLSSAELERTMGKPGDPTIRVVYVEGTTPLERRARILSRERLVFELSEAESLTLGRSDYRAYTHETATKIKELLSEEKRRSAIANRVLAVSTVVFLGLIALLLLRALRSWSRSARRVAQQKVIEIGSLRLATVELLPAGALRELVRAFLQLGAWVSQLLIVYAWTVTSLSLFDSTRALAERATGTLFAPALALVERLAGQVPAVVALGVAFTILALVIRFMQAYFAGIERGDIEAEWVRPETARVTGHLLTIAVGISALLFVAPLLTGSGHGVFTRMGELGLGLLAISSAPLLASCALGVRLVYTHVLRRDDLIRYGGQTGTVLNVGLFDLVLKSPSGSVIRVPHLLSLWHPTELLPPGAPAAPRSSDEGDAS